MAEKLSQQPAAQVGTEADFGMVVQSGQTRRQTRTQLRVAILSAWQTFIGTFLGAANITAARAAIGAVGSADNITGSAAKITTARNIAATGDVTWNVTFDGSAAVTAAATVGRKVGADFIDGLHMIWVSANALTLQTGSAYIESLGTVLSVPTAIAKTGLTLAAATKYHVYLFSNAGAPDIEIVTTAPSAKTIGDARTKTGDTSRRYIGSIYTLGANTIIRFKHCGNKISYLADTTSTPLNVLTLGQATVATAVSCAAAAPETASHISVQFLTTATGSASLFVADPDGGTVATTYSQLSLGASSASAIDLSLSAAQTFAYLFSSSPGAGGVYARVQGYVFER